MNILYIFNKNRKIKLYNIDKNVKRCIFKLLKQNTYIKVIGIFSVGSEYN